LSFNGWRRCINCSFTSAVDGTIDSYLIEVDAHNNAVKPGNGVLGDGAVVLRRLNSTSFSFVQIAMKRIILKFVKVNLMLILKINKSCMRPIMKIDFCVS